MRVSASLLFLLAGVLWWGSVVAAEERQQVTQGPGAGHEDVTQKSAPQIYSYRPRGTQGGVFPISSNPNNPTFNPAFNPAYNPSYNPSSSYPWGGYDPRQGFSDAFTVRHPTYSRAGATVKFSDLVTQVGSGWNVGRSEFVAVTPGLYFFTFTAISDRNSYFRLSLRRNGVQVVSAYGDASGYQMGAQGAVLQLNRGDRVYLQLDEGQLYDSASTKGYTAFSGFKLF